MHQRQIHHERETTKDLSSMKTASLTPLRLHYHCIRFFLLHFIAHITPKKVQPSLRLQLRQALFCGAHFRSQLGAGGGLVY